MKKISFTNRTRSQIKAAYAQLKLRYKKVILPLMAQCSNKGGLFSGVFQVG